jgi:hypothetical protein
MAIKLYTVTVPKHYEFLSCLKDDAIADTCDDFEVVIRKTPAGDFAVTAPEDNLRSFVEEICIDDEDAVDDIMNTVQV